MNDKIQVLKQAELLGRQFNVYGTPEEPLFKAKDVARFIGHSNTSKMVADADLGESEYTTMKLGTLTNSYTALMLTEDGLYEVLMQSRKPIAKEFKKGVKLILKQIRRTGGYIPVSQEDDDMDILCKAVAILNRTVEEQKKSVERAEKKALLLESQNEAQSKMLDAKDTTIQFLRPGATFAKAVQTSETSCLIGDLARIIKQNGIEIGQNRLFEWLRQKGYLIRRVGESYNLPTQQSLNLGLFEIKKTIITKPNGNSLVTTTPKVTGKGQVYFVNKFLYDSINEAELKRQRAEQSEKGGAQ